MTNLSQVKLPEFLTRPDPHEYLSDNYVVLDFETTVLDKGSALNPENSIVLAVWERGPDHPRRRNGRAGTDREVAWAGEYNLGNLVKDIRDADYIVAHNAKFELQWLERCGLDIDNVLVWCTQVGEYVIGGNRWVGHALSLENCAQRRYGEGKDSVITKLFKTGHCSTEIPASWLEDYCVRDVELTHRLFLDQRQEQQELDLLPVMYTRCLATPVLADIERNGMQIDGERIYDRRDELEREFAAAEHDLELLTGGINLNSPKQLGEFLYDELGFEEKKRKVGRQWKPDRTKAGGRKTDADTVQSLKITNKRQGEFIEAYKRYKELYNELTKYLRKFADCAQDADGVLHASFNQTNTQTHRLSSTGTRYSCQFQNFPRSYKPLFKARHDGWLVGECDGAQLEFRVAAHLGRDPVALEDIVSGTDIHSVTAGVIGCTRQDAKPHTFKPLYGGRSGTEDEVRYYEFFREKYEGIAETQQAWIDEVLTNKYLLTEWGMRYYWPHVKMEASGYVKYSTNICNYPVQAFATAEIIPIALVYFWHISRRLGLRMILVNTIHDSIIVELPPDEISIFHQLSEECLIDRVYGFLDAVYDVQLTVPLGAGVKVGTNWNGADCGEWVPQEAFEREGLNCEIDRDDGEPTGEVVYNADATLYVQGGV